jgi:hypothetical protein
MFEACAQDEELTLKAHSWSRIVSPAFLPAFKPQNPSAFRAQDSALHPHSDRALILAARRSRATSS